MTICNLKGNVGRQANGNAFESFKKRLPIGDMHTSLSMCEKFTGSHGTLGKYVITVMVATVVNEIELLDQKQIVQANSIPGLF